MKRRGLHKMVGMAAAGVALAVVGTLGWSLNMPPTANCSPETAAKQRVGEVRAAKVVVQPWLGQHHVYGVFMVPDRYRDNKRYAVTIRLRGVNRDLAVGERSDEENMDAGTPEPGHFLWLGYVPTRVALWFLLSGRFGELRHPCNWTLVFIERVP